MSTTYKQETEFNKIVGQELPKSLLQSCIDWIRDNMNPDEVFEVAEIASFVGNTKMPQEVFTDDELRKWATDNGFTPPEKTETQLFVEKVING